MGNSFVNSATKRIVGFSNSVTDSLYSGILIEGSAIAENNWQKRLMTYLADRNQNIVGLGIVGIDIIGLEWTKSDFINQKEFLLKIVRESRINKSYNKYVFQLKEDIGNRMLKEIENLIDELSLSDIATNNFSFYAEPPESEYEICNIHRVYMNYLDVDRKHRCLICSNDNAYSK